MHAKMPPIEDIWNEDGPLHVAETVATTISEEWNVNHYERIYMTRFHINM